MENLDELYSALDKADAAGNGQDAADLAAHIRFVKGQTQSQAKQPWFDVAAKAHANLPGSTWNLIKDTASALAPWNISDTAGRAMDLAAGELSKAVPKPVADFLDKYDPNPAAGKIAKDTATQFNDYYTNPVSGYGSVEGFKTKLANDPASVLADASTLFTLGGLGVSKVGAIANSSKAAALANALKTAGNVTNPLSVIPVAANLAGDVAKPVGGAIGKGVAGVLGMPLLTGKGGQNIAQSVESGYLKEPTFLRNMYGLVPEGEVVNKAKSGLQGMQNEMSQAYQTQMKGVLQDKTPLGFDNIDAAMIKAKQANKYNGVIKSDAIESSLNNVGAKIQEWKHGKNAAEMSTPQGLDELRKSIESIRDGIPANGSTPNWKTREYKAVNEVYNQIKSAINDKVPGYSSALEDYAKSKSSLDEIQRDLALGDKRSIDTATRKLQATLKNPGKNNAAMVRALNEYGGGDLMPALSGQAMNSWTGGTGSHITQAATATGSVLGGVLNPLYLAALMATSPKIVGTLGYGAGAAARHGKSAADFIASGGDRSRQIGLMLNQANQPQNNE